MSNTLLETGLGIAGLLLAAADNGVTYAREERALGVVIPDPDPLRTGWPLQPCADSVFAQLMERPCESASDRELADLLAGWWEAGYFAA